MSQQVLEGAWEEIAEHADELSGKRVKLIVLDESRSLPANGATDRSRPSAPVKDREELFRQLADQWRKEHQYI